MSPLERLRHDGVLTPTSPIGITSGKAEFHSLKQLTPEQHGLLGALAMEDLARDD